jgi:hypothetical protein
MSITVMYNVFLLCSSVCWPIPVAARSKTWVCGRSLTGIAGSNPALAWMSVSFECCVLPGRGLCDGLITRPEKSYRVWCVSKCDREASTMKRPRPSRGCCAVEKKIICWLYYSITNIIFISLLYSGYRVIRGGKAAGV